MYKINEETSPEYIVVESAACCWKIWKSTEELYSIKEEAGFSAAEPDMKVSETTTKDTADALFKICGGELDESEFTEALSKLNKQ